jgi:hypothetical protein
MESNRRYTRINPNPECTLVYLDLEKLVTWRNLRKRQIYSSPGNPKLETYHFVVHVGSESLDLFNMHVESTYVSKLPPKPLIDL